MIPPSGAAAAQYAGAPSPKQGGFPTKNVIIAVLIVLLLAAGGGGYFLINAQASDVSLEMATSPGPTPFAPSAAPTATPPAAPPAAPAAPRKGPNGVAIYGGSGNNGVCDKQKLIDFLTTHSAEGSAWASVEGISAAQIPAFIGALEPEVLSRDVRVTNHGFVSGKASPFQAVFQAGTAVLVNQFGYPVARCLCGNPLTPPTNKKAHYVGQAWAGFSEITIIIYVAPPGNVPNVPTTSEAPSAAPNNLPPGFPTNLTPGTYDVSVCIVSAAANLNTCTDAGTTMLTSGDVSALAQGVSQAVAAAQSSCPGSCTVQYTPFDGSSFSITIAVSGCSGNTCASVETQIHVTKVG